MCASPKSPGLEPEEACLAFSNDGPVSIAAVVEAIVGTSKYGSARISACCTSEDYVILFIGGLVNFIKEI